MESRRDFIKKLTALSGSLTLGSLPGSIQRAFAINPDPGTTYLDAEHIVFLMQENRSFDHLLGTLQGVRGFNDPRFLRQKNGNPIWLQSDGAGKTYAPVRSNIKNTNVTWSGGCPHAALDQVGARNLGYMDKWIDQKTTKTMQYFTREDHPFYYALADAFTVCDHYFCSSLTGTSPNRSMFWTGKLTGRNVFDPDNSGTRDHMDNSPFMIPGTCDWLTFPEVLYNNGVSWKVYQNQTSFNALQLTNLLGDLAPKVLERLLNGEILNAVLKDIQSGKDLLTAIVQYATNNYSEITEDTRWKWLSNFTDNVLESFIKYYPLLSEENRKICGLAQMIWDDLPQYNKDIHSRAFTTNIQDPLYNSLTEITLNDGTSMKVPAGDILYQFRQDVKNGELPTVSWLVAPEVFSDHPSSAQYGPWYVSEVLDILTSNPDVWKKTIFIINFDENDGFFDHMPPYVAEPAAGKCSSGIDPYEEYSEEYNSPIGTGFRVPMLVVSPWSRGGWVNSQIFDHTSTLMFLEKFLQAKSGNSNIKCDNISQFRRTVCGDLTSAFRPYNGENIVLPKPVDKLELFTQITGAKNNADPGMNLLSPDQIAAARNNVRTTGLLPKQEEGIRPGNGLLYQLFSEAKLNKSSNSVDISFEAGNEIYGHTCWGAAFNLYWGHGDLGNPGDLGSSLDDLGFVADIKRPRSYVVKTGDTLKESLPLLLFDGNVYHVIVYGPNGFSREFSGDSKDPDIDVSCLYEYSLQDGRTLTGNVEIRVDINDPSPRTVIITDNAYSQPDIIVPLQIDGYTGIKSVTKSIKLDNSLNWYDFTVRVSGYEKFYRRYTGHVETGQAGYTDPYMGLWDGSTKPGLV